MGPFETLMRLSYDFDENNFKYNWKWGLLDELYEKNFVNADKTKKLSIPKKIHQIWLGSPLPDEYQKLADTWKKFNPDWEYKLWTDDDIHEVQLPQRVAFNRLSNYGQKSDILRYYILNKYGGIYADTDFECLKSLNDLPDFGLLLNVGYPTKVEFYNSLVACDIGDPVMQHIVDSLDLINVISGGHKDIFETTGSYFMTRCVFDMIKEYTTDVTVLPPAYFFPFPNEENLHLKNPKDYIHDCSYAVHLWECSWIKDIKQKRYGN